MSIENTLVTTGVLFVGIGSGAVIVYFISTKVLTRWLTKTVGSEVVEAFSNLINQTREKAEYKAFEFLRTPKTYLYLDKEVVESLYCQISGNQKITMLERETIKEDDKSLKPKLPIIEGELAKKGTNREKEQIEFVDSPELKNDNVISDLVSTLAVTFDIENFDYDKTPDEEFIKSCNEMEAKTGNKLPTTWKEEYLSINRNKQVQNKIAKIESSKGNFVLMRFDADVTIEDPSTHMFVLEGLHPLNTFRESSDKQPQLKIQIRLAPNHLTEMGLETFSTNEQMSVKVFGKLISFDKQRGFIIIKPISIF